MRYHPQASSPYAPPSRASLLRFVPSEPNNPGQRHRRTARVVILYLLLKFWDKPFLQDILKKIVTQWGALINVAACSENELVKRVVHSDIFIKIGGAAEDVVKRLTYYFVRSLMYALRYSRAEKYGVLSVPDGMQDWAVRYRASIASTSTCTSYLNQYSRSNQNQHGNENKNENESESEAVRLQTIYENGAAPSSNHSSRIASENNTEAYLFYNYHMEADDQINRVLNYWFGQFNPDMSQKQLWMIASSSAEHRTKIDAEIYDKFSALLMDLSTSKQNVTGHGNGGKGGISPDNKRGEWCSGSHGWRGFIASIIVLDQMSRHIHRHYQNQASGKKPVFLLAEQKKFDAISYDIAQEFQNKYANDLSCGMIPMPMVIFALMPLRHKSTLQSVGYVQTQVEKIAVLHGVDMENMIRRFRRATNRRMAVLQDEARREGKATMYEQCENDDYVSAGGGKEEDVGNRTVEKYGSTGMQAKFDEDGILDFHYFEAEMACAEKSTIVRTMMQFLAARGVRPCSSSKGKIIVRDTPVIVSLSGGVDSMVIAAALAYLRDKCNFAQLYIVAVHIDYGNRPESAAEAAYVKDYALNRISLDRCIVRVISEVTRGVTKRDEYEILSRNIRYDLYRDTVAECIATCNGSNPSCRISEVGVMLGHHRGDVVENVISNSNKGKGPLDLSGMTSVSRNDGVTIYRPLLPLEKVDVFDYSHKYGVPYFKDTTPHWSTRGKLRNKLVPLLMEVYGDGCLSNLASLAEESDEARDLFNKTALEPFLEKVQRFPMGILFRTEEFSHQGSYFWKIVLKDLLHSAGLGMFSEKSVQSFLKRILPKKITSGWLQCRKDYAVYLLEDRRVMVLYPDSFPWRKADHFTDAIGIVVPYGEKVNVGPWEICCEIKNDDDDDDVKPVFSTWEEFLSGNLTYSIKIPKHDKEDFLPLVVIDSFTKLSRPSSWKGMDLKVQSTLPLLGHCDKALAGWVDSTPTVMASVSLKLQERAKSK